MNETGASISFLLRVVALAVVLLCVFTAQSDAENSKTIRVATYNINFANTNLDTIVSAITKSNADIVALQETTPKSEDYIRKQLGSVYSFIRFKGGDGKYFADRSGFLSKYEFKHGFYLKPKDGIFGVFYAMFLVEGKEVQVVNVHLNPLNPYD